jgi:hypothetical protein
MVLHLQKPLSYAVRLSIVQRTAGLSLVDDLPAGSAVGRCAGRAVVAEGTGGAGHLEGDGGDESDDGGNQRAERASLDLLGGTGSRADIKADEWRQDAMVCPRSGHPTVRV